MNYQRLEAEYLRYYRNARRCGYWPYRTWRIQAIELVLAGTGRLHALLGQSGSEAA